ncbi:hypothetical protein TruAng_001933 [Truncatella angustata]|nr:hypothetical protein TruAng_001933 [Truncatella angustata]
MLSQLSVTGTVLKRFTQASTLLWLLDPVRGEPTIHSLDRHPNDTQKEAGGHKISKFLDSISLFCATRKNGDTVSAAALEEGAPEGTVLRIASNAGLPKETVRLVKDIIEILNEIAEAGSILPDTETHILRKVIELDILKISHYLEKILRYSPAIQEDIGWVLANPSHLQASFERRESLNFLKWIANLRFLTLSGPSTNEEQILAHIRWAASAKWEYGRFLESMFKVRGLPVSPWVVNIYKLGRYAVAGKVLLYFALENRALFRPMLVEALPAPPKQSYRPCQEEKHLKAALRRSIGGDVEEHAMRLGRYWDVSNPEIHFRRKCPRELTVHAELQLVNFYDHNRDKLPHIRFIGVSKKSCFLCHKFLQLHPSNFNVSACHQKLYLNWIPPPCSDHKIYKQYRTLASDLSVAMEKVAKHDIEQRLGLGTRRVVPLDSTAGVSFPSAFLKHAVQQSGDYTSPPASVLADDDLVSETSPHPSTSTAPDSKRLTEPDIEEEQLSRDLVTIKDLIDMETKRPCWEVLGAILASDKRFGISFDPAHEFLLINQNLRIGNARQFTACLEYLQNAQSWNNEAVVCGYDDLSSA